MELYDLLLAKSLNGGGGGGVTVEELTVTENGDYSEAGKAYSPVHVNVSGGSSVGQCDLLASYNLGEINYSGTTAQEIGTYKITGIYAYDALIAICSCGSSDEYNRHIADVQFLHLSGTKDKNTYVGLAGSPAVFRNTADEKGSYYISTTKYGVYVDSTGSPFDGNPGDNGAANLTVKARYNAISCDINGTYTFRVYGLEIVDRQNSAVIM